MRTERLVRLLVLSTLTSSIVSCYAKKESQVVGTYEAQCSCVTVTLVVRADHTFEQIARDSKGQETARLKGNWNFDSDGWVQFKPFLDFTGRFIPKPHDDISNPGGYYAFDPRGDKFGSANFRPESYDLGYNFLMGPLMITCPNNASCKADYIRTNRQTRAAASK